MISDFQTPSIQNTAAEHLLVLGLFLLLPDETLLCKLFADWTENDWRDHVWSAYWKINGDTIVWAPGRRTRAEMRATGLLPSSTCLLIDWQIRHFQNGQMSSCI